MFTPGSGHLTRGTKLTKGEFRPGQELHLNWAWEFQGHLVENVLNFVLWRVILNDIAKLFAQKIHMIFIDHNNLKIDLRKI